MSTFIQEVINDLKTKGHDFSKMVFILPSRRAGTLLQKNIAAELTQTIFAPSIFSIEEFIQNISGLQAVSPLELVFTFYEVYLDITPLQEQESFQSFISWAPTLLDDINEVDRHLLNHREIFNHLNAIQELDHWSKTGTTDLIKKHLKFWNKLPLYYTQLSQKLISQNQGHQGLLYRKASEEIEFYIQNNISQQHVFLGFNALNTSEERIIQAILANGNSSIYWDAERHFMESPHHNAAAFLKKHKANWKHFTKNTFQWISTNFNETKKINCTAVPQNIDQVKYVAQLLASLDEEALNKTAVILGDENVIIPLLNSLPPNILDVNITMGLPLSQTPIASFFQNLFTLQSSISDKGYYYKNIIALLKHPLASSVFNHETINNITQQITKHNAIYVSVSDLLAYCSKEGAVDNFNYLFSPWKNTPLIALKNTNALISFLLQSISFKEEALLIEYLKGFKKAFNKLETLCEAYAYIEDIKVLERFYTDIMSKETIDLKGNPHKGLQIMGMLESRVLDFETVIITSVNEGVLPSGKSSNSFLPYDIKMHYGLPTYTEKDSVYTYHFYRLLHRAKNVELLYTTSSHGLGSSEKSRLILQLEAEGIHTIHHQVASAPIFKFNNQTQLIQKTPAVQDKINTFFKSGISPSAIGTYLRNPLDFYYKYLLRVTPPSQVEETIASNTMGTIVHNVLERLYLPFKGEYITVDHIKDLLGQSKSTVDIEFKKESGNAYLQGQNLIIYEVICRFIENFLRMEIHSLKSGATLKIHSLENKLVTPFNHPRLPFEINLKGTVDRVDVYNNTIRVIDYKTGVVEKSNLKIKSWEDLLAPEGKYEKAFQILLYAYMLHQKSPYTEPVSAGIISTKKIQNGFMPFMIGNDSEINADTFSNFETILAQLIQEISNPEIPFEDSGFSYS